MSVLKDIQRFKRVWSASDRDRLQVRAGQLVGEVVDKGFIDPPEAFTCVDCDRRAEMYDHRNYYKPLQVQPVCRACNVRRGPGYPLVSVADRRAHKNLLPAWDLEGSGKGYVPQIAMVHANVDWQRLEDSLEAEPDRAGYADFKTNRVSVARRHQGARYEYFKAHDPWRLE